MTTVERLVHSQVFHCNTGHLAGIDRLCPAGRSTEHCRERQAKHVSDNPEDHWFYRHKWWLLGVFGAVGTLVTQFHYIEPNVKRMAELTGFFRPTSPMPVVEPAVKKVEPPKPTVACLKASVEMILQLKALPGEKMGPCFQPSFQVPQHLHGADPYRRSRRTANVLV